MDRPIFFQTGSKTYRKPELSALDLADKSKDSVESAEETYRRIARERPGLALLAAVQSAYRLLRIMPGEALARRKRVFEMVDQGDLIAAAHDALPDGFALSVDETHVSIRFGKLVETTEFTGELMALAIISTFVKMAERIAVADKRQHGDICQVLN